jgi:hypothetical protein
VHKYSAVVPLAINPLIPQQLLENHIRRKTRHAVAPSDPKFAIDRPHPPPANAEHQLQRFATNCTRCNGCGKTRQGRHRSDGHAAGPIGLKVEETSLTLLQLQRLERTEPPMSRSEASRMLRNSVQAAERLSGRIYSGITSSSCRWRFVAQQPTRTTYMEGLNHVDCRPRILG